MAENQLHRCKNATKAKKQAEEKYKSAVKITIGEEVICYNVNELAEARDKVIEARTLSEVVAKETDIPQTKEKYEKYADDMNKIIEKDDTVRGNNKQKDDKNSRQ